MKRRMFSRLAAFVIAAILMLNFTLTNDIHGKSSLSLNNFIEMAIAGPEGCRTAPDKDIGECKMNVNGNEWNCIKTDSEISWDCFSD